MTPRFADRHEAGAALGHALRRLKLPGPVLVVALPRGGVPVAAAIARLLDAELDVVLVRKVGAPGQPELAVGAVAEGDPPEVVVDEQVQRMLGVDASYIDAQAERELQEIARRRSVYRPGRGLPEMAGRTVIVVDDGIATGCTMRAALRAVRRRQPALLVLAVPVAAPEALLALQHEVDRVVCLSQPVPFHAVGAHYEDFRQVDDQEVIATLQAANRPPID